MRAGSREEFDKEALDWLEALGKRYKWNASPPKPKENKMLKLLRRAILLWVGFGIAKLCILAHPFVVWFWTGPGSFVFSDTETDGTRVISSWCFTVFAIFCLFVAGMCIHQLSKIIFNEGK